MKQFFEIRKVDEELRMVWGYASTAAIDSQGESVTKDAITAAWDEYIQFGNIREMHQPSAVGVVKEYNFDDAGVMIGAYIVDDVAWKKVTEKVYKGFSIGGKKLPGGFDPVTKTITALKLTEISLVDRPANPEALITMWKADTLEEQRMDPENEGGQEVKPVDKLTDLIAKGSISPERLVELAEQDINKVAETVTPADKPAEVPNGDGATNEPVVEKSADTHLVKLRQNFAALMVAKGASADDIKKGMWGISDLAQLINSLRWLQEDCAWEAANEGDNSPLPAQLAGACKSLCAALVAMAQEECAELIASMGLDMSGDPVIAMGEMVKGAAGAAELGKYHEAFDILKAGARNSASDMERIQKAHDLMNELGATCIQEDPVSEKLHKAAEAGHIAKALGDFEKMAGELGELRKSFGTLQTNYNDLQKRFDATPTAPKGGLKVIEKGDDISGGIGEAAPDAVTPVLKQDGSVDDVATMIKKVHAGGGRPIGA